MSRLVSTVRHLARRRGTTGPQSTSPPPVSSGPGSPIEPVLSAEDWQVLGLAHHTHRRTVTAVDAAEPGLRDFLAPFTHDTSENGYKLANEIQHRHKSKAPR